MIRAIQNRMPFFLEKNPVDKWESLVCDDLKPRMERLKIRYDNNYVINIHRTFSCLPEEACYHTHPAPMWVKLYRGRYELRLGYGKESPGICSSSLLLPGCAYSMELPHTWHYHRALDDYTITLAIEGENFREQQYGQPRPSKSLRPLTEEEQKNLYSEFTTLVWEGISNLDKQELTEEVLYLDLNEAKWILQEHEIEDHVAKKDALIHKPGKGFNVELIQNKIVKAWWNEQV